MNSIQPTRIDFRIRPNLLKYCVRLSWTLWELSGRYGENQSMIYVEDYVQLCLRPLRRQVPNRRPVVIDLLTGGLCCIISHESDFLLLQFICVHLQK